MTRFASLVVVLCISALVTSCGDDDVVATTDAGGGGFDAGGGGGIDSGSVTVDAGGGGGTDAGATGDTWSSFAMGFFATYCVDCHGVGTTTMKNFNLLDDVRAYAPRIRCGVSEVELTGCGSGFPAPRQFPIGSGPRPTDPERARLAAWIDAGLPE